MLVDVLKAVAVKLALTVVTEVCCWVEKTVVMTVDEKEVTKLVATTKLPKKKGALAHETEKVVGE